VSATGEVAENTGDLSNNGDRRASGTVLIVDELIKPMKSEKNG